MMASTRDLLFQAKYHCGERPSTLSLFRRAEVTCLIDDNGDYREGVVVWGFDGFETIVTDEEELGFIICRRRSYLAACRTYTASI